MDQDARDVNTKNSKTFPTFFFPVGDEVRRIVEERVAQLRENSFWGSDDPLFPAIQTALGDGHQFKVTGLRLEHWRTTTPIRSIFRAAFTAAGLPYFNPHSLRKTLVALGQALCKSPEELKAWSQNLGHDAVLTTLYNYGAVQSPRQAEIIRDLAKPAKSETPFAEEIAEAVVRRLNPVSKAG